MDTAYEMQPTCCSRCKPVLRAVPGAARCCEAVSGSTAGSLPQTHLEAEVVVVKVSIVYDLAVQAGSILSGSHAYVRCQHSSADVRCAALEAHARGSELKHCLFRVRSQPCRQWYAHMGICQGGEREGTHCSNYVPDISRDERGKLLIDWVYMCSHDPDSAQAPVAELLA